MCILKLLNFRLKTKYVLYVLSTYMSVYMVLLRSQIHLETSEIYVNNYVYCIRIDKRQIVSHIYTDTQRKFIAKTKQV